MRKKESKNRFDVVPVVLSFPHEITADVITILRKKDRERTLLGQLEDKINEEIIKQGFKKGD
jgi:hypothetical protein